MKDINYKVINRLKTVKEEERKEIFNKKIMKLIEEELKSKIN